MVNPVPVAPTLDDATDLTIAMDLSGPFESRHVPPISASLISDNRYRRRILKFVEAVRPQHGASESSRVLFGADQPRSAQVRARSKPYVVRRYR
jgi:hypothetical protein